MYYPLNLIVTRTRPYPLFGKQLKGKPFILDLSDSNPDVKTYAMDDFQKQQMQIFDQLRRENRYWGIGRYLEDRRELLSHFPQMVEEERFFHVGLDIIVPEAFTLYAPLDGEVAKVGFDEGVGNYGGYVILRHMLLGIVFYSFYGHLNIQHIVEPGQKIEAGDEIGHIGAGHDSGGWFTHTHLQVITEEAYDEGRYLQGYVTAEDLEWIDELFPTPYPLFAMH